MHWVLVDDVALHVHDVMHAYLRKVMSCHARARLHAESVTYRTHCVVGWLRGNRTWSGAVFYDRNHGPITFMGLADIQFVASGSEMRCSSHRNLRQIAFRTSINYTASVWLFNGEHTACGSNRLLLIWRSTNKQTELT